MKFQAALLDKVLDGWNTENFIRAKRNLEFVGWTIEGFSLATLR